MKKSAVLVAIIINCTLSLFNYYHSIENAYIETGKSQESLTLISFNNILFMSFGSLFLSSSIYILVCLNNYRVGKILSIYLFFICITLYLAPVASHNIYLSGMTDMLAGISCILLFHTFGIITLFAYTKQFLVFSFIQVILFLICIIDFILSITNNSRSLDNRMILLTVVIIFIMCVSIQKSVTEISKKQIKIFGFGILMGGVFSYLISQLPVITIISAKKYHDMQIDGKSIEVYGNYMVRQYDMPILVFTIVAVSLLFLFMERNFIDKKKIYILIKMICINLYILYVNCFLIFLADLELLVLAIFNLITGLVLTYSINMQKERISSVEEIYGLYVIEEIESEKQKLAVELHDDILQNLISILHKIQNKNLNITNTESELVKMISKIRNFSHELYPIIVMDIGLKHGLELFLHKLRQEHNITINYQYNLPIGVIPDALSLMLYRIIKELAVNAVKHSKCSEINIYIKLSENNRIVISVQDNGIGFVMPSSETLVENAHMGLYSIKRQVKQMKGEFYCIQEKGTKFVVIIDKKHLDVDSIKERKQI